MILVKSSEISVFEIITNIYKTEGVNILFIDAMFQFLSSKVNGFSEDSVMKLFDYIQREEFDTDLIEDDNILDENISSAIDDEKIEGKILDFVKANNGNVYKL